MVHKTRHPARDVKFMQEKNMESPGQNTGQNDPDYQQYLDAIKAKGGGGKGQRT